MVFKALRPQEQIEAITWALNTTYWNNPFAAEDNASLPVEKKFAEQLNPMGQPVKSPTEEAPLVDANKLNKFFDESQCVVRRGLNNSQYKMFIDSLKIRYALIYFLLL